jgi:hypothetical protein
MQGDLPHGCSCRELYSLDRLALAFWVCRLAWHDPVWVRVSHSSALLVLSRVSHPLIQCRTCVREQCATRASSLAFLAHGLASPGPDAQHASV